MTTSIKLDRRMRWGCEKRGKNKKGEFNHNNNAIYFFKGYLMKKEEYKNREMGRILSNVFLNLRNDNWNTWKKQINTDLDWWNSHTDLHQQDTISLSDMAEYMAKVGRYMFSSDNETCSYARGKEQDS